MNIAVKICAGFLVFGLLGLFGYSREPMIAVLFVFAIGWPIGWILGSFIKDGTDVDVGRFKAIGWANLIAWIIPIVGIIVGRLSASVGNESIKSKFFYDGMSIVGYGLVILNVALYTPLTDAAKREVNQYNAEQPADMVIPMKGERSSERCEYAALEGWSEVEFEIYCNRDSSG
ncbi:MAG: hypothetical protein AAF291_03315 [Pseudomonadota bacterium]